VFQITPMVRSDCEAVLRLWDNMDGIAVLPDVDTPEYLCRFLQRNPGCSFVAHCDGKLVGAILGGHDSRRGFLYHMAVVPSQRGRGLGRALAGRCLEALRAAGIHKVHLFVFSDNDAARAFWAHLGFRERTDIAPMSITLA
jgi:ribosomal protein S18 acetylase RimI-like enzyme